jgi:N-acetylneuraminate synthase
MEFTECQWKGLKEHAETRGLRFLSSPFSVAAVDLLSRVGVAAWKVASGEVGDPAVFQRMVATGLPLLISTGMSPLAEIDAAVAFAESRGRSVAVLQCTTAYPCLPEKVGLNMISYFRDRYGCRVGLSDHSGTIYPGLAAATLGADLIEVHVTLSREMFGPDVPASLTTDDLRRLVEGVRFIEAMRAGPVDKDAMAREVAPLRGLFTKSVVAGVDLPAGAVLRASDLRTKKPGTGIPAQRLAELVGRCLRRPLVADTLISEDDLEP